MLNQVDIFGELTFDIDVFGRFTEQLTARFDIIIVEKAPICFAKGTMIRTPGGEIAIENLSIGDQVVTASGAIRPIMWIGRRSVDCQTFHTPADAWPVRIAAHAFGDHRPSRDLFVSPQHAVAVTCLDEVLIPVKYLINGGSIAQVARDAVDYYHLELDAHDLLFADNLAMESFLDTQGREGFFDNGAEYAAAHPEQTLQPMNAFCRPLVLDGPVIAATRAQLHHRMVAGGWYLSDDADLHVVADGIRIDAIRAGDQYRFTVPAETRSLRLRSKTFVPQQVDAASGDGRSLGVAIAGLAVTDGLNPRVAVALEDGAALLDGFSFLQNADGLSYRWTDGDAGLDAHAWEDAQDCFFLTVTLAPRCAYRGWQKSASAETNANTGQVVSLDSVRLKSAA